jgi:hypothetical protein
MERLKDKVTQGGASIFPFFRVEGHVYQFANDMIIIFV